MGTRVAENSFMNVGEFIQPRECNANANANGTSGKKLKSNGCQNITALVCSSTQVGQRGILTILKGIRVNWEQRVRTE